MKFIRGLSALAAILSLSACSSVDVLNATIPSGGYQLERDIAYGSNPRQTMDVYIPDDAAKKPMPVVLFFYGGSWQNGSKNDYRFLGQAFASRGIVTVVADYRLYPEVKFPDFVRDGAKALKYVHAHIAQYGGNPKSIFVAGHSAGAFNAAMLSVNDKILKDAGVSKSWIKGTIGISGPYDFLPMTDPDIIALFGGNNNDSATQPVFYVHGKQPPMLLVSGDADDTVIPRNTYRMQARLKENGSDVTVKIYPDIGHIGIILSLARGFRWKSPLLDDIDQFVHRTQ